MRVVAELEGSEIVAARGSSKRDKSAIVGRVLVAGHEAYDALVGQAVDTNRNPVTYFDDSVSASRTCACGCGTRVFGQRQWVPGHDQRAVTECIARQWGSNKAFIDWFDAAYPPAT